MGAILGSPDLKNSRKAEIIATELGYLWANLLQRGCLDSHRSLGFCAIGDDEGANTLTANLALYLGGKGMRIALIECTLRAPAMAGIFMTTGSPGLSDHLQGNVELRDVLRPQVAPGVDLVPGGETADAFWAFTSERFQGVARQLLTDHDLCLIDVPALNRAPEASLVIRSLSAVVLVVEANRHRAEVVGRNVAYLRSLGTPFLGAVISDLVHEIPRPFARLF